MPILSQEEINNLPDPKNKKTDELRKKDYIKKNNKVVKTLAIVMSIIVLLQFALLGYSLNWFKDGRIYTIQDVYFSTGSTDCSHLDYTVELDEINKKIDYLQNSVSDIGSNVELIYDYAF